MEVVSIEKLYEIERGKPMPSRNHTYIQSRIPILVDRKYSEKYIALSELSLDMNGIHRVPDLSIYTSFEPKPGNDDVKVSDIPMAVIEILSPKQNIGDLLAKAYTYFDFGIKSYWLIVPDLKTFYVFSEPNEYEVFAKKGMIKDEALGIELLIEDIYRGFNIPFRKK